jgi:8-amino-7-oxononanoate synthase
MAPFKKSVLRNNSNQLKHDDYFSRAGDEIFSRTSDPLNLQSHRRALNFRELPSYQFSLKHRNRARLFGVEDPFYRCHEDRPGANLLIDGRRLTNFASYDYLGWNNHPAVGQAATAAIDRYGTSVSASRIVAGENLLHRKLESALADHYQTEAAIAFVSGHATNVSTIATVMGKGDLIIHDDRIHNSAVVGAKLSQATTRAFRHNDLGALEALLGESRNSHKNALVIVEGLYSMEGDFADLRRLIEIKERFGAWLMVDEAHALGVLGSSGRGSAEYFGVDPRHVDIWMGTLSKTLASCGGYIAGTRELIEILKFYAPGFVYSVGMSPAAAAAATKALELLHAHPERVHRLQSNGNLFLEEAKAAELDTGTSAGIAIVPVMIGDTFKAGKLTERLLARGFNVLPIIYPAVPMKAARLRFFISSEHTPEQIRDAVKATRDEMNGLNKGRFAIASAVSSLISQ